MKAGAHMRAKRFAPAWILMIVAAAFVTFGLLRGEDISVLRKSVTICLECIGLG